MGLLDFFEKIYIINLPDRKDRRKEMEDQLLSIGINPMNPKVQFFAAIRPESAGEFPTVGTRGCFLSHLGVLSDAKKHRLKNVLILEDDLNFVADFGKIIPKVLTEISGKEWGMFYGGYELHGHVEHQANSAVAIVEPDISIITAHFLAFQGEAISGIVDYLEVLLSRKNGDPKGGPMHVDGAYYWFRRINRDMVTLISIPELGFQRKSKTDIHNLFWFDRMPLVRNIVALLRKIMNKLT